MEWVNARYNQIIPCNWGYKQALMWMNGSSPLNYLVADAQNLIVKKMLDEQSEWLFLIEQDNVIPPDCFLRLNDYMRSKKVPIVSGLYFTKTRPGEPMVYRGRGNSFYTDWKIGDKVWVDGVPAGTLLIHQSILRILWNESPEYQVGDTVTRRVFSQPQNVWHDPEKGWNVSQGTSDLEFCSRIIVDRIFEKAGWPKYQKMRYPFLIDTNIFVGHIDDSGNVYPSDKEKQKWMKSPKKRNQKILQLA